MANETHLEPKRAEPVKSTAPFAEPPEMDPGAQGNHSAIFNGLKPDEPFVNASRSLDSTMRPKIFPTGLVVEALAAPSTLRGAQAQGIAETVDAPEHLKNDAPTPILTVEEPEKIKAKASK